MDILFDIFIILLALCGMGLLIKGLYDYRVTRTSTYRYWDLWVISGVVILLISAFFIADSYLGGQSIEAVVIQAYKGHTEEQSNEFSISPSGEFGIKSQQKDEKKILKEYEVAVVLEQSKEASIFTNDNDLFRWKFNNRAIQVHMETGKRYKFKVYGFLGYKNILEVSEIK